MPNILTLSVVDHKADDYIDWFNMLEQGLFSTSGAGTEATGTALFSADTGTMELRLDYVTTGGKIHVTSLSGWDEGVAAFTATFATPEPMGGKSWIDVLSTDVHDALLGNTRIKMTGHKGDDWASGFDFNDRFQLGKGNDAASGGDGNDVLLGQRGKDLLIGGADDDVLKGGKGRDMLIAGPGDDTVEGGGGNDVLVFEGGTNVAKGGAGNDIFLFDSFSTTAGGSPNVLRTTVQDFEAKDLLVFGGWGVSPDTIDPSSTTLEDIDNSTIDEFRWFQRADNLVIRAGDAKVTLKDTTADQVDLDMILFTEQSATEAVDLFDSSGTSGTLGTPPGGDPYLIITMENWSRVGDGTTSFDTYGGDISGFYLGAFPEA